MAYTLVLLALSLEPAGRGRRASGHRVSVIGFDVQPDGRYAVVGIDDDERIVLKQEGVALPRLIRIVWEYRPHILATDNIFELSNDESLLRKILSMLPEETEVVQVTRTPEGGFTDLRTLAAIAGIRVDGKPSPLRTAYLAAVLAKRGYGARIVFTEEKTKIVISRARHGRAGGMSQLRYQRGVKASILRATRVIKKLLDKHGFDYDLIFRKSGYGLESAVFIVYAPRSKLYGIIRNFNGRDVRIEIRPVYTGRIQFESLQDPDREIPKRHLIIGVDPGIVTGVAAVDLQGRPVFVYSRKGLDRAEIIEIVKKYGIPVMIATDVTPAPENVKKLAASLGVPLFTPPSPLTVDEKQELVAQVMPLLGNKKLNAHERDALAAALRAFREHSSKLRQIESIVSRYPAEISLENLKASVIRGLTIAEALEAEIERMLTEKQPKPFRQVRHLTPTSYTETKNGSTRSETSTSEQLEAARARIKVLEDKLRECNERVKSLENEIRLVKLEAEQRHRDKLVEYQYRIETLQHELEKLRATVYKYEDERAKLLEYIYRIGLGEKSVIPALRMLNKSALAKLSECKLFRVKRVFYVAEPGIPENSVLEALQKLRPLAVIIPPNHTRGFRETLEEIDIPVVEAKNIVMLGDYAIVDVTVLEEAYLAIAEVLARRKEAERSTTIMNVEELKKLIELYRRERYTMLEDSEV